MLVKFVKTVETARTAHTACTAHFARTAHPLAVHAGLVQSIQRDVLNLVAFPA